MTITSRPYRNPQDLEAMKALLRAGTRDRTLVWYAHPGDLDWWVFYNPSDQTPEERIRLWEDEAGRLLAWTHADTADGELDLFVHPQHGGELEAEIAVWMEQHLFETVSNKRASSTAEAGKAEKITVTNFLCPAQTDLIALLESRGYQRGAWLVCFSRSLAGDVTVPSLPEGFTFLDRMRVEDAEKRAAVHFSAFSPRSRMTADYYRGFMRAPGYDAGLDIVTVAPDGRFASFAMAWFDPANRLGLFEPVGTHQDFQRKGLGRATLLEGMRRLKARGAADVVVCTGADQPGNIAFYESVGFRIVNRVDKYTKTME